MSLSGSRPLAMQRLPVEAPVQVGRAEALAGARYWRPPDMRLRPRRGDSYVVVDDLVMEEEHRVVALAVTPWPTVDERGRLTFAGRGSRRLFVDPVAFQASIDKARANDRRLVSDVQTRPLRIGGAFLVRGLRRGKKPTWTALEDATAPARDQAKVALFAAVALPMPPQEIERLRLTKETAAARAATRRPPGPTAARPSV